MKKIIGFLICILLLSMTFSVVSAQKTIKEYEKQEINGLENSPPSDPVITCPNQVRKNRVFLVSAVSTDPDGDQVYYRIKVFDEGEPSYWIGPRDSGQEYTTGMGIFQYTGEVIIGFQAKDEYGAESEWSYHTLVITTARSKSLISPIINILQNYPILYQLLQKFIKI